MQLKRPVPDRAAPAPPQGAEAPRSQRAVLEGRFVRLPDRLKLGWPGYSVRFVLITARYSRSHHDTSVPSSTKRVQRKLIARIPHRFSTGYA